MKKTTDAAASKASQSTVKKNATEKPAAKKAAAPKKTVAPKKTAAKSRSSAVKKQAAQSSNAPKTTILANVDVGFGNSLYLRGDAPGLSWSQGVPMDCQSDSTWTMAIAGVSEPFEFKVLINDSYWSSGYNESAKPGETVTIHPKF